MSSLPTWKSPPFGGEWDPQLGPMVKQKPTVIGGWLKSHHRNYDFGVVYYWVYHMKQL